MSRLVSRAENWERIYTAFSNINFAAFDYNTIKQSIRDYIRLYFPESFSNFIETDELIILIESFAYVCELLAYRLDVNAHENFLPVAQRKDSILRLAKFISYTASRPLPARGLVKITSVQTTESVVDANGNDLANTIIKWNDISNSNWKDQFILIVNRVLGQEFGTVGPSDRFQLQNVLFELYSINNTPLPTGVLSYSASVGSQTVPMELVPIVYDTSAGIIERRPHNNSTFSVLYGQDGLGDSSDTTGFFCFTKQGTLQAVRTSFDGITPNQTYNVTVDNVNDTDVWVNNVDPATGKTLDLTSALPQKSSTLGKSGEWVEVDLAHAQNVIFNTNPQRNKYELETIDSNRIRVIFGDGDFADIPSGTFDIWVRTSTDADIVVPQAAVVNTSSNFSYVDTLGRTQTLTFTYSLISSLQNASASETLEHIRTTAPSVYYTQDRMVNGQDYNVFMLQDPSILKLRSINRTFAGDSKYIAWHDPSGTYENVKIFGTDGRVFFVNKNESVTTPVISLSTLINTYIEPLLSSTDIFLQMANAGVPPNKFRKLFSTTEKTRITTTLTPPPLPATSRLYFNIENFQWYAISAADNPAIQLSAAALGETAGWPNAFIQQPLISVDQTSIFETSYSVTRNARKLEFQSAATKFWNTNAAGTVIDYNTLNASTDQVVILQSNINNNRNAILKQSWPYYVIGQEIIDSGVSVGLPDTTKVSIIPVDTNNTGIPPDLNIDNTINPSGLADIIKPKFSVDLTIYPDVLPGEGVWLTLPIYYIAGQHDIQIVSSDITKTPLILGADWVEDTATVSNRVLLLDKGVHTVSNASVINTSIDIAVNEYVYFTRMTTSDDWVAAEATPKTLNSYLDDQLSGQQLWIRYVGRGGLNFAWFHYTTRYHLVDPAQTNIHDTFIITKGYFLALKQWLQDSTAVKPIAPTPLDLRTSYNYLLANRMWSDTVVLHPGKFKLLFGSKANSAVQAQFKVIKSPNSTLTDNQIKTQIVTTVRNYFDITMWEFGETFYFSELSAAIHLTLNNDISSVQLVPSLLANHFGVLQQVLAREDEIFYPDINVGDIVIVTGYTTTNLNIGS